MGLSIKKDIATSLTSLIFIVILIGGLMVFFPFLDLSMKKVLFLFGIVFIFLIILNFTISKNYFKRSIFVAILLIVSSLFLNTPNNIIHYGEDITPIENNSIKNSFIVLGNNISIIKDSKELGANLTPLG